MSRFSELRRLIPGITQRMPTRQLRDLARDGLVHRAQYPEVPPKVVYSLTTLARSLTPLFAELCRWGEQYMAKVCATRDRRDARRSV